MLFSTRSRTGAVAGLPARVGPRGGCWSGLAHHESRPPPGLLRRLGSGAELPRRRHMPQLDLVAILAWGVDVAGREQFPVWRKRHAMAVMPLADGEGSAFPQRRYIPQEDLGTVTAHCQRLAIR